MININTPYVECSVRREITGLSENLSGYIFGCKGLLNYPLLFHFQGSNGVILWNLPISAFIHKDDYELMGETEEKRLQMLETWDVQSNAISIVTFKFLQHKMVDVFSRDGLFRRGIYHFTIDDYEGDPNQINVGYANDSDSKCFHFIELDNGNFCVQPNNLLRWHNADFIKPYPVNDPPKIKLVNPRMSSESRVDLTYADSPYYVNYQKNQETNEATKSRSKE